MRSKDVPGVGAVGEKWTLQSSSRWWGWATYAKKDLYYTIATEHYCRYVVQKGNREWQQLPSLLAGQRK